MASVYRAHLVERGLIEKSQGSVVMRVADFHDMVEGQEFQPFQIRTRGGKVYRVPQRSSFWLPEDYEATVIIALRGQGSGALP